MSQNPFVDYSSQVAESGPGRRQRAGVGDYGIYAGKPALNNFPVGSLLAPRQLLTDTLTVNGRIKLKVVKVRELEPLESVTAVRRVKVGSHIAPQGTWGLQATALFFSTINTTITIISKTDILQTARSQPGGTTTALHPTTLN
jgi:hypothetical protein